MTTQAADVIVADHGTVVTFLPQSEAAKAWFDENVERDVLGGFTADHRPARAILEGIEAEGFVIR